MNLTRILNDDEFDADSPGGYEKDATIPKACRNATMSCFAGIVIKKYGDTEKAYQSFLKGRDLRAASITTSYNYLAQRPALLFKISAFMTVMSSGGLQRRKQLYAGRNGSNRYSCDPGDINEWYSRPYSLIVVIEISDNITQSQRVIPTALASEINPRLVRADCGSLPCWR